MKMFLLKVVLMVGSVIADVGHDVILWAVERIAKELVEELDNGNR